MSYTNIGKAARITTAEGFIIQVEITNYRFVWGQHDYEVRHETDEPRVATHKWIEASRVKLDELANTRG